MPDVFRKGCFHCLPGIPSPLLAPARACGAVISREVKTKLCEALRVSSGAAMQLSQGLLTQRPAWGRAACRAAPVGRLPAGRLVPLGLLSDPGRLGTLLHKPPSPWRRMSHWKRRSPAPPSSMLQPSRAPTADDVVDAGFVPKGQLLSTRLSADVRRRAEDAIARKGGRVTVGDVAAAGGLTLGEAESALKALAADCAATLQVWRAIREQRALPCCRLIL